MAFHLHMKTRLLIVVLSCFLHLGQGQNQCFFPNGETAVGDVACNPSAADSVCCGKGWTCLSSKVCEFNQDDPDPDVNNSIGEQWRGSCTDKSWGSSLCPKFCYERNSDWAYDGPQWIRSCGQKNYCCQPSNTNSSCCEDQSYFVLEAARPLTVISENPATLTTSSASTTSTRAPTSSLSSTSTSSSPSPTAAAAAPAEGTTRDESDSNNSINKGLAAGLGIVLGLALIGGILFGLYKWDQRRRIKKQPHYMKRSSAAVSAPDAVSLPTTMADRSGQMEWELPTRDVAHEAPAYAQTRQSPIYHSGFSS